MKNQLHKDVERRKEQLAESIKVEQELSSIIDMLPEGFKYNKICEHAYCADAFIELEADQESFPKALQAFPPMDLYKIRKGYFAFWPDTYKEFDTAEKKELVFPVFYDLKKYHHMGNSEREFKWFTMLEGKVLSIRILDTFTDCRPTFNVFKYHGDEPIDMRKEITNIPEGFNKAQEMYSERNTYSASYYCYRSFDATTDLPTYLGGL